MRVSESVASDFAKATICSRCSPICTLPATELASFTLGRLIRFAEALWARLSYLFVRNMSYKFIYDRYKPEKPTNDLTHREKGVIGAIAGALGTLVSNAPEAAMVRKITDVGRPTAFLRQNVTYNPSAGLGANLLRNMILNGIIIWPYDQMKERMWITFGETFLNVPIALAVATFVGSISTILFDNLKTRLQAAYQTPELNRLNYHSAPDAFRKAFLHEGHYTFLAGFYPYYLRMYFYSIAV